MTLRLRWEHGKLFVCEKYRHDEQRFHLVATALLPVWRLKQWPDSRRAAIGPGCRALAGSITLGLRSLVMYVRAQPNTSEYVISKFGRI